MCRNIQIFLYTPKTAFLEVPWSTLTLMRAIAAGTDNGVTTEVVLDS